MVLRGGYSIIKMRRLDGVGGKGMGVLRSYIVYSVDGGLGCIVEGCV